MKKYKQKKKKHLKRWVKILAVLVLLIPCFFFAKDVYAEYYPFTSIIDESDPEKEISYSAIDHTFVDENKEVLKNRVFVVKTNKEQTYSVRSDENGQLVKGLFQDGEQYHLYDDNGYLMTSDCSVDGVNYKIHEDGNVFHNEWDDGFWYEQGQIVGKDEDRLVFVKGEKGFYCLNHLDDGKKKVNSSVVLNDGREVRFDENGNIVSNEVYAANQYYFPVAEANEEAEETYSVPVSKYVKNTSVDGIRLINHRGYHVNAPENTLAAYIESKKMNYQYVETDVQLTSDEVPVLLHNPTLSHMAGINVAIDSITEEEAKQFNLHGQTITSLEEFIAYCKANLITPYIELKTETIHSEDQVKMIFDIVEKYEMVGKVEWISFSSDLLRMVAQYDQTDMLGYLAGSKSDVSEIQSNAKAMKEDGCNVFFDVHYAAQMSYLDFCKENDIPLELWGINSIDVMNTLDGYITGVTTDTIRN